MVAGRSEGGHGHSVVLGTGSADPKEWEGREHRGASPSHRSHRKGQTEAAFMAVLPPDHTRNEKTFKTQT